MQHPVRFSRHSQQRVLALVLIPSVACLQIQIHLGIPQGARPPLINNRATGYRRRIGQTSPIVRPRRIPNPHKGCLIPIIRRLRRQEICHHNDRQRGTKCSRIGIQKQKTMGLRFPRQLARHENAGANQGRGTDRDRTRIQGTRLPRQGTIGRIANLRPLLRH